MTVAKSVRSGAIVFLLGLLAVACQTSAPDPEAKGEAHNSAAVPAPSPKESEALFSGPVKDLLEHRCIHCHHTGVPKAGLNFQDRSTVFSQGFVIPGRPDASRVWLAIARPWNHPRVMPGDGWGATDAQMDSLKRWIETGAAWPEGSAGALRIKEYQVDLDDGL